MKEGARGGGKASTLIVTSTVDGTIIDVPVKVGFSVIQANWFNPGTTVATIANMDDMIFDGHVDEAEVAKIKIGMKLKIKVGAIEKDSFDGTLEFIAPQGKEIDGAIQFEIKAAVVQRPDRTSAPATPRTPTSCSTRRSRCSRCAKRSCSTTTRSSRFVEVETTPQVFVRKDIKVGLSDGIQIEVLERHRQGRQDQDPGQRRDQRASAGSGGARRMKPSRPPSSDRRASGATFPT